MRAVRRLSVRVPARVQEWLLNQRGGRKSPSSSEPSPMIAEVVRRGEIIAGSEKKPRRAPE